MNNQDRISIPCHEDRLLAWKYTYAHSSFAEAETACKLLLTQKNLTDSIIRALVTEVVIAYYRPFTGSQLTGSIRRPTLTADLVPTDFKDVHEMLKDARDCAIGHHDATAFPGLPLNRLLVRVRSEGIELHRVSPSSITHETLLKIAVVCDILMQECRSRINHFVKSYLLDAGLSTGDHLMSTDENPNEWLMHAEKFWPKRENSK